MQERRLYKRQVLVMYLHIFDLATGKVLGYLGDVSSSGLMLVGEHAIPVGEEHGLGIRLQKLEADLHYVDSECVDHIRCHAQSRWNSRDGGDLHGTGFLFLHIAAEDKAKIDHLIQKIGVPEGCEIRNAYRFADAMIHLDDSLDAAAVEQIVNDVRLQPGVVSAGVQADLLHVLIAQHSLAQTDAQALLDYLTSRGIRAKLLVMRQVG
jgi:hypothetical protein